jgi:hypothetical protein
MDDKINGKSIKVKVDHYQAKGLIATQWAIWLVVSSHLDNIFPFVAELPPLFEQYSGQLNFHSLFGQSHVPLGSLNNMLISIFQSLKLKIPNQIRKIRLSFFRNSFICVSSTQWYWPLRTGQKTDYNIASLRCN